MKIQLYRYPVHFKTGQMKDPYGYIIWLPDYELYLNCYDSTVMSIGKKMYWNNDKDEIFQITPDHIYLIKKVFLENSMKGYGYLTDDVINLFPRLIEIINSEAIFGI